MGERQHRALRRARHGEDGAALRGEHRTEPCPDPCYGLERRAAAEPRRPDRGGKPDGGYERLHALRPGREHFDYGERWSLDENGEWAENQYENVVYFGGGDGPAPFTYTVEEGTLRAVHWVYTETAETIYGTGDENARMAYLALAAAQKGTSLFNIRSVVKQIGSNSWAGDADYSAAWKNVEMRYDARIEGEYYYSEGFFLSVQDGQPITVTLTFDARLAE